MSVEYGENMSVEYMAKFTIYPGNPEYAPITIGVRLNEYQARVLMATPVQSVNIAVQRAGGMIIDETPEPLVFGDGGNVPRQRG